MYSYVRVGLFCEMGIANAPNGEEMDGYTEGRNAFFIKNHFVTL